MMITGAYSQKGVNHSVNEDTYICLGDNPKAGVLVVVCDGVSSAVKGKEASETTCSGFQQLYDVAPPLDEALLWECLLETDWHLVGRGRGETACTMSMAWLHQGVAHIFQIGDSPIWLLRNGTLQKLTPAHTDTGALQAFMGMGDGLKENLFRMQFELQKQDILLLFTDGITVSEKVILQLHQEEYSHPNRFAEALVHESEKLGSKDDLTAVVVHYLSPEMP
jgi:serine/threonine protein phosphatase PrpC